MEGVLEPEHVEQDNEVQAQQDMNLVFELNRGKDILDALEALYHINDNGMLIGFNDRLVIQIYNEYHWNSIAAALTILPKAFYKFSCSGNITIPIKCSDLMPHLGDFAVLVQFNAQQRKLHFTYDSIDNVYTATCEVSGYGTANVSVGEETVEVQPSTLLIRPTEFLRMLDFNPIYIQYGFNFAKVGNGVLQPLEAGSFCALNVEPGSAIGLRVILLTRHVKTSLTLGCSMSREVRLRKSVRGSTTLVYDMNNLKLWYKFD